MTVIQAINEVDNLKPNMYGLPEKIKWLSRLDTRIFEEILLTHRLSEEEMEPYLPEPEEGEETPEEEPFDPHQWHPLHPHREPPELVFNGYTEDDTDTELIVKEPYDEIYVHWLEAQIDWNNMEYAGFNNTNAMFESVYSAFRNFFNRTHMPLGVRKNYF